MGLDMSLLKVHKNYFEIQIELDKTSSELAKLKEEFTKTIDTNPYKDSFNELYSKIKELVKGKSISKVRLKHKIFISLGLDDDDLRGMLFNIFPLAYVFDEKKEEEIVNMIKEFTGNLPNDLVSKIISKLSYVRDLIDKKDEYIKELVYWRKVNAIHGWFVENVQDGLDNCEMYRVSKEKLQELKDLIDEVLEPRDPNIAREKLPPVDGPFFGSQKIDDKYWEDLEYTKKELEKVISNYDQIVRDGWEVYYVSSW